VSEFAEDNKDSQVVQLAQEAKEKVTGAIDQGKEYFKAKSDANIGLTIQEEQLLK
jgi:hypothetical protein